MLERFLKQAEQIVADHKAQYKGVYYMKGGVGGAIQKVGDFVANSYGKEGWNGVRDALETGGVVAGNYALPGSSLLTSHLTSEGSQKQLNSGAGKIAQVGSGLAGAGVGSSVTGVPSAAASGAGWGNLASGIGNAVGSAGESLGLTSAGTAAPWVDPDIASAGGAASPWVNPDAAVAPGASASNTAPWVDPDAAVNASGNSAAAGGAPAVNPNNLTGSGLSSVAAPAPGLAESVPNTLSSGEASFLGKAGTAAAAPITGTELSSLAAPAAAAAPSTLSAIKPWIGPAISGAGLAMSAIKGAQPIPAETALKEQASQGAAQGQQLQSYIQNGTLPPGAQAGIDQAKNAAKAAIRSKYASMGMSGSSSEQQELSAVESRAQAEGEQQALQLLNTGINESNMSSQLYEHILNNTMQNDQALSSAVSGFAGSVAGAVNPLAAHPA